MPKAKGGESAAGPDAIAKRLMELGERFMNQFDDDERPRPSKKQKAGNGQHQQGAGKGAGAAADAPCSVQTQKKLGAPAADGTRGPGQAGPGPSSLSQQPQAKPKQVPGRAQQGSAGAALGAGKGGAGKGGIKSTSKESLSEIDAILNAAHARSQAAAAAAVAAQAHAAVAVQPPPPSLDLKRERKLFMSHKASKVHEVPHSPASAPAAAGRAPVRTSSISALLASQGGASAEEANFSNLSSEEFQRIQLEVERLGATGLDKKSAKAYRARLLERLGAKADKAPRQAASIGKGVARMAGVREARALEEAIAAGMVQRKGLGKKKKREAAKGVDKGLHELGGGFKGGVLRLKKPGKVFTGVRPSALKMPAGFK